MGKAIRTLNWTLLIVLTAILLMSVFNHFGNKPDHISADTSFGLLFFLPLAVLIASSFVGRKYTKSALVATIGIVFVLSDMMLGMPFPAGPEATYARWLIESAILFTVVSLVTHRSSGARPRSRGSSS